MKTKYSYILLILILCLSMVGCSLFSSTDSDIHVARVGDSYLTREEVNKEMSTTVITDSTTFVKNYINNWATNELLFEGAMRNTPTEIQDKFEKLVSNYKRDLYTKYYSDVLLNKELDSVVSELEAVEFYEINRENFRLNEPLLKFKFIHVDENYDLRSIQEYFTSSKPEDMKVLDSLRFQFKNYFLNDSIWVKQSAIVQQVNPITSSNVSSTLKKSDFIQLRDSLGLYLVAVKKSLERNDIAPLQYVRPTINQIIINQRKLALIKKLEKEIKDDAIKNKEFEIYN